MELSAKTTTRHNTGLLQSKAAAAIGYEILTVFVRRRAGIYHGAGAKPFESKAVSG